MDYLQGLNPSQLEAVTTTEGYIRVIAGAGSGKTRALSHRFAYLVNDLGILPGNILCVTFTNKSANEMRQRIHMLTGDNDTGYINTFHGFCVSVLQEDSYAVQYPKNFLVLDNEDINAMLASIYEERGLTLRDMPFNKARDMIEMRKTVKEPKYYEDMITMSTEIIYQKYLSSTEASDIIFYGYLYQEKKCFGLDYNDLIVFTLYIFANNSDTRLKWQKRLEYIMIDEFQDIDPLQYELMEVLCAYHKNLFIVGDPDQTIYTWRGANVRYLLDFDQKFPDTRTIMMTTNYRSAPEILSAANSLIDKNKMRIKKELTPVLPSGQPVFCHYAKTSQQEALWISEEIQKLHENGIPYKDISILYRAHYVSRSLEEVFMKKQIPYVLYSGVQFFGRKEIKDTLSYLRFLIYKDDLSFLRIINTPKRNIGKSRIAVLKETAENRGCTLYEALLYHLEDDSFKRTKGSAFVELIEKYAASYSQYSVSEILSNILNESEYEKMLRTEGDHERLDNLAELKQSVYEYEISCGEEATLEQYLSHVALFSNMDTSSGNEKVKMMTIHTAKGLEFPYVFLCALNEGILPSGKTRTRAAMEEERRLAFVALTRAQQGLYLSEAMGRNFDGSPRYPSRFLLDIDQKLLTFTEEPEERLIREAADLIRLSDRFLTSEEETSQFPYKEGQRICHPVFGDGTVIGSDPERQAHIIQFDNMETLRMLSYKVKLKLL